MEARIIVIVTNINQPACTTHRSNISDRTARFSRPAENRILDTKKDGATRGAIFLSIWFGDRFGNGFGDEVYQIRKVMTMKK